MSRADAPVVLHVLEAIEGGTARHVVDLTRHVHGFHHEVAIPRRRPGRVTDVTAAAAMGDAGATVHFVEMRRLPVHPANAVAVIRLRRLVHTRRPALVHLHSSLAGALGRVAAASGPVGRVYTPHGINPGPLTRVVERVLGHRTDRVVALSPSDAERIRGLALTPPGRVVLVRNGIDLEPPPPATDLRALAAVPAGVPLVGTVCRLVPDKAPEDFVRVCAAVAARRPEVHFLLVGGGPGQSRLDREVARSGLGSRFHQLRAVTGAGSALGALDVFVQPSRTEAGPYAPLEAMRAGVPVVLSDAVGNRDVVEPGRSGVVRAVGDVSGMADEVVGLLADQTRRRAIVAEARLRLVACFDVRRMGAEMASLYQELLSEEPVPASRGPHRRRRGW